MHEMSRWMRHDLVRTVYALVQIAQVGLRTRGDFMADDSGQCLGTLSTNNLTQPTTSPDSTPQTNS